MQPLSHGSYPAFFQVYQCAESHATLALHTWRKQVAALYFQIYTSDVKS